MIKLNPILAAFLLTTFAGLSTGFGSAIPFFFKSFKKSYLAFFMGLSAGVMILVSFAELMPNAIEEFAELTPAVVGNFGGLWAYVAFFAGIVVVVMIDFIIPHEKNLHHMPKEEQVIQAIQIECSDEGVCEDEVAEQPMQSSRVADDSEGSSDIANAEAKKLTRAGLITALAIAIHNFPEGMATFAATLDDISVGISIAIAIAIHNIPEGISVSIPLYYASKSKWKSFAYSFASGVAEPVGAGVAFGFLQLLNLFPGFQLAYNILLTGSLAFVAGIMVYISIDELIPIAREYGKGDVVMAGVVLGMLIMAGSLLLFEYV